MVAQYSGIGRPLGLPVQGIKNLFGGAAQQAAPEQSYSTTGVPVRQPVAGGSFTGDRAGGGFLSEVERAYAAGNQGNAIAAIRRAQGGGRDRSLGGDFREGMLGQALRAFLAMQMPNADGSFAGDPVGQANAGLADIVSGATGGGFGGVLRGQAANLMGQDFSGLDDSQILPMLAAAANAGTFGYGDFAQYAPENALAELENQAQQSFLGGSRDPALAQPGALNAFQQILQQYLATK